MKTEPYLKKHHRLAALALMWMLGLSICSVAQPTDWKWQNPLPTGNYLYDVQFVDSQTGWMVGERGAILKTINGGSSWVNQSSGTTNWILSLSFISPQTGWAVGSDGIILKTSNGGTSWQSQTSGFSNWLTSVHFEDAQIGWAVGNGGTILKTVNGGQSWIAQNSGTTRSLSSVQFLDAQTGWVAGDNGTILKTTNGGTNWVNQVSAISLPINSICFTSAQNGFAVGNFGTILKTSNGGSNWEAQVIDSTSAIDSTLSLYAVSFTDSQTGWIVGDSSKIFKTNDGGGTWQLQNSGNANRLLSSHFTDSQTGWTVGDGGTFLKTTNGGNSWENQSRGNRNTLRGIQFTTPLIGWAVGYNGTILKTTSGGGIWQSQNSGTTKQLYSVHFANPQIGWATGDSGTILKTENGGNSWQSQNSGTVQQLFSVHFPNTQIGYAVGFNGTIIKTSNGGVSWQAINNSGNESWFWSVHFVDELVGWVVGLNGTILKTMNGGNTWEVQNSGMTQMLGSVHFTNALTGWAVGYLGTILKTTNGGSTWQRQISGTQSWLYTVHFTDQQNGWAAGDAGVILKTSNGGNSWNALSRPIITNIWSVYFTDPIHGWAVGENGTIVTTTTNNPINPETLASLLSGSLFEKSSSNCDPTNIPVPGKVIKADPGPYYAISNQGGNYELRVPISDSAVNFTLQPVIPANAPTRIETVCPPSGQIDVQVNTSPDTLAGNNFGFEITQCHHLDLQMSSNRRRRCFTNSTDISYFNEGALPAANAYLLVEFPRWVRPLSSSRSHIALSDSVWRFNLGDIAAGSGGQFSITDSVICGNLDILGLSQCTKATAFPAPNCPPSSNWSGAAISLSGQCKGQSQGVAELGIYNRTAINMPDSVEYFIYLDSIEVKTGKVKLAAGDSLKFQVETNSHDVHITAMQVANHPTEAYVSLTLEGCTATTSQPRGIAMHFPIQQQPNSKTQCLPIIGAYDPNDKQVFPLGFTANRIVPPNTKLEYLVRFQNTGNDTAFTVYIIDTLHTNLNVESFEMGAASHPYQLSMQTTKSGKTWLRWQFNNILLPDSGTNQLASNGFVQFRISPKPNLPLGTQVYNEADIYFDFNPPILTNQTLTTFDIIRFTDTTLNRNVRVILPTGIPAALRNAMKLYPNPVTNNQLNINFAEAASLTLYNARGLTVYTKTNLMGEHTLPISLMRGMYVARIQSAGGSWSEKVVVE